MCSEVSYYYSCGDLDTTNIEYCSEYYAGETCTLETESVTQSVECRACEVEAEASDAD